ncbi:MAG: efflux RND transporter permease subunit [Candidatus Tectomicrobia bacterium]
MRQLVAFSVQNRVLVNLLTLLILGVGGATTLQMHREIFPDFSLKTVRIETSYHGASPEEVETLITAKIETEVTELDGLDELLSVSQEGLSEVLLKFRPDVNMNRALNDVRAALDNVTTLPDAAEEPRVHEVKSTFPVITVSLAGDIDTLTLQDMARDLRDALQHVPGVAAVQIFGSRERQIWVEVDPSRLDQYRLSLDEVRAAIAAHNRNVPGGTLKTSRGEILVRTLGEAAGTSEVERMIVRSVATGTPLTVADVAHVRDTFEEPTIISRWSGRPAITLMVIKQRTGDAINIAAAVRTLVAQLHTQLPHTVTVGVFNDLSVFIRNRLNTLRWSGAIGLIIVVATLCVFVRTRIAFLTGLGIPFAMLGGMVLMSVWGISLNMMSLFSLILVLGLLVDDAIVVAENVYRYVEEGMTPQQAAIRGTTEVAWPVVATVLTTVATFLPLILLPGSMGVFLAPIPLVVTFTLAASLFEALVILPSHLSDVMTPAYAQRLRHQHLPWLERLRGAYQRLLAMTLRWRYVTTTCLLGMTILLAATAVYRLPFILFQEFELSQFIVNLETSPENTIEASLAVARQAERVILGLPAQELKSLTTNVGVIFLDVHRVERGANLAQMLVELEDDRQRSVSEIIAELRTGLARLPGIVKVQFLQTQSGPGGPAIEARVVGDDIPVLRNLAAEVKTFLHSIPGIQDIRDDFTVGKEELQITLRPEARALGLDLSQIARQVQQGFLGVEASTIQRRDEDVPIIVRFPPAARRRSDTVATMKLTLLSGESVFLRDVAQLRTAVGISKIRRYDQKRAITVLADVDTDQANAFRVAEQLKRTFADVGSRLPGYRVIVAGERQEAETSLAALPQISLLSLLLIYVILGTLFRSFVQPLVVMATIPFAMDGVVIGHLLMGEPLNFLSFMGLVALIGVVVNDSLLLVDFINRARQTGTPRDAAILAAGVARLRPVLLTTVTTVGGLIPLAFFATGQAKFLSPMAISIVWGLAFATILTLILIPCLYALMDDVVQALRRLVGLHAYPTRPSPPQAPMSTSGVKNDRLGSGE